MVFISLLKYITTISAKCHGNGIWKTKDNRSCGSKLVPFSDISILKNRFLVCQESTVEVVKWKQPRNLKDLRF